MATDSQKLENRARLWGMSVTGMTLGIWGMVEESATSLAPQIGSQILELVETKLGRKVDSQKPDDAVRQLAGLFIDEFGYAAESKVEGSDKQIRVSFAKAISVPEFALLAQRGSSRIRSCRPGWRRLRGSGRRRAGTSRSTPPAETRSSPLTFYRKAAAAGGRHGSAPAFLFPGRRFRRDGRSGHG
jgi:hypothetical protein